MSSKTLLKNRNLLPSLTDDFFKPWNDWFNGGLGLKSVTLPAVNIVENKDNFILSLAAPGLKKEDFTIDVNGNLLTISSEKEDNLEEEDANFTRREYSFTSFSRSFTLPETVNMNLINAQYENGILKVELPKIEEARKKATNLHIDVN